jgi:outer membrane autotransporter protein
LEQKTAINSTNVQLLLSASQIQVGPTTGITPTGGPSSPTPTVAPPPTTFGPIVVTSPPTAAPIVVSPPNTSVFSFVGTAGILGAQLGSGLLLDRIGGVQSGPATFAANQTGLSAGDPVAGSGSLWLRGIGTFISLAGAPGGSGSSGSTGGFLAGFDRPVADNAFLGLAAGYMFSTIDSGSAGTGSVGSARVAIYGGLTAGADRFAATVGYANDRFRSNRTVAGLGTATESHGGDEFSAAAQWSRPLPIPGLGGGTMTVTPKLGIRYVHLAEAGYTETGVGGSDLSAPAGATDSLQPYLAVAFSQKFATQGAEFIPEVRFGYGRELFGGRNLTVTAVSGTVFPVAAVAQSRDRFMVGASLAAHLAPSVSVRADYDAVLHSDGTTEQAVQAGGRLAF